MISSVHIKLDRNSIQAAIFDMDGVVIDSEPTHELSLIIASEQLGRRMSWQETKQFKGSTELDCARLLIKMTGTPERDLQKIGQLRLEAFRTHYAEVKLVAGVVGFLEFCKGAGWPLALTTSAPREFQELAFHQFDLSGYFEVVVTGDDVSQGKPHPEPYLKTAQKLGCPPSHCVVVEDSMNGVRSAKAAGCPTVGLATSFSAETLAAAGSDLVVESFIELQRVFFGDQGGNDRTEPLRRRR
jgi:HAD superfamily hydrolase (TIGR01509 family)